MEEHSIGPRKITVHCTGTENGQFLKDGAVRTITAWHKERGFDTIGYHMVIDVDGEIQKGRPLNYRGAHVSGENDNNIGIAMIGTDKFNQAQWRSLRRAIKDLRQTYPIGLSQIYCHNDFASARRIGKTCPSFRSGLLMAWFLKEEDALVRDYTL